MDGFIYSIGYTERRHLVIDRPYIYSASDSMPHQGSRGRGAGEVGVSGGSTVATDIRAGDKLL